MTPALKQRFTTLVAVLLGMVILSGNVQAQTSVGMPPPGICTTDPTYNIPNEMQVVTLVVDSITCILYGSAANPRCTNTRSVAETFFNSITSNNTFFTVLSATGALFVIIFAISFMIGIVQLSIQDFIIRAFKFSLVVALLSPASWSYFYSVVGVFFQNGTNWLIAISMQIGLGIIPGLDPSKPFMLVDSAIATAFSSKMFITTIAMLITGPYGWLFALLVFLGLGSFIAALFQAVWIYLMSMIVRAFLFGLAPIFLPFVLFSKTRHLFDGWLSQLINTMLQPALLFSFFAFFSFLVQAAMQNLLKVPVCFMPGSSFFPGAPNDEVLPRFTLDGSPYGRGWGFNGPVDFPGFGIFPISIMDVLIFLLLTQLAWRFNGLAINIAKEISGSSTSYNIPGAFSQMLSSKTRAVNNVLGGDQFHGDQNTAEYRQAMAGMGGGGGGGGAPAANAPAGNAVNANAKPAQIPASRNDIGDN